VNSKQADVNITVTCLEELYKFFEIFMKGMWRCREGQTRQKYYVASGIYRLAPNMFIFISVCSDFTKKVSFEVLVQSKS